jgi:hypothetical protein
MTPNILGGIAGDYSAVITAGLALGTAVWSVHTNRVPPAKK